MVVIVAVGAFASIAPLRVATAQENAVDTKSDWYPSRFGPEDTIGAANFITEKTVREAAKLVDRGKIYSLAVSVDPATPPRSHRKASVTVVQAGFGDGRPFGPNQFTANDDAVYLWQGLGTQIDGFAHAGINFRYYNGVPASEFVRAGGVTKFSVHDIPPLVARGVVLDLAGARGVKALNEGEAINVAEIREASKRQGVALRKGDVVLLHTGWMDATKAMGPRMNINEPGLGLEGARYLAELGVIAIGSDNDAVEVLPSEDRSLVMPVHQEMLARNGVYLLENIVTRELVNDKAWEFLFVLAAPRVVGTVQGNVHPVAIR
ncbi:MAG: cyclase family protein [Gammaproteobacteria bacterium]|jgi:kynurenine formamidase